MGESTSPLPRMPGIASSQTPLRSGLAAGSAVFPVACVDHSRPEASRNLPSGTHRQCQCQVKLGRPQASAGLGQLEDGFRLAGPPLRPYFPQRSARRSLELEDALAHQRAYAWDDGSVRMRPTHWWEVAWRGAPSSIGLSPSLESESNSPLALVARLVATIETAARGWVARARLRGATR